jgi:hypothetical protein
MCIADPLSSRTVISESHKLTHIIFIFPNFMRIIDRIIIDNDSIKETNQPTNKQLKSEQSYN